MSRSGKCPRGMCPGAAYKCPDPVNSFSLPVCATLLGPTCTQFALLYLCIDSTVAEKPRDALYHNVSAITCPFARTLPNLSTRYFENKSTDFDANWQKWSTGQGHETINSGGQEVKDQGHTRPMIDLYFWWKRHS